MKNLFLTVVLILGFSLTLIGQNTPLTPPGSGETQQQMRDSRDRDIQANQRVREIQDPRVSPQYDIDGPRGRTIYSGASNIDGTTINYENSTLPRTTHPVFIPARLSKEQLRLISPSIEDSTKYATFLKLPHTGLIKLFPEMDCSSKNVVRVDGPCEKYIPFSNAYSFRKIMYPQKALADLRLKENTLFTDGIFSNGMILALGDIPLETVSANIAGMDFLFEFKSARENNEIIAKSKELGQGIKVGNYQYSNHFTAFENTTYVLRTIAYRGSITKTIPGFPWAYNLLEGDKRIDVIIAFRIVRKDSDGSLTLLWKELQRKDSPKINLSKKEQAEYSSQQ